MKTTPSKVDRNEQKIQAIPQPEHVDPEEPLGSQQEQSIPSAEQQSEVGPENQSINEQPDEAGQAEDYQQKQNSRGVCYLSRIPPYMKPNYIRKLLEGYLVERIYLLPESEWSRKNRIKRGGNKKTCFRQGWVQFADKRMAKMAALTLNGNKMVSKKGNFYSEDLWNIKYLPKFKWHHLTERLAHEERLKKERLKVELEMERKVEDFYSQKIAKSKVINGIVSRKLNKGKLVREGTGRNFPQAKMAPQIKGQ